MARAYNFSAGPAALPVEVLQQAREEILDWHGSGMSVMEMSHRGKEFMSIAERAEEMGIARNMIFIDPGIGFGKTLEHNLLLLRNISKFVDTEYRVLVGTSRKRFIGSFTGREKPCERIFGTAATVALCAAAGVSIVRVHDVAEMVDVVNVSNELK